VSTPPKWRENRGYGKWSCVFSTFTSQAFDFLLDLCYERNPNNEHYHKVVKSSWVNQLTWRSLAYWYMDDGTLQAKSAHFMTHSFTQTECLLLAGRLRRMGLKTATVKPTKKNNKTYWLVVIPTEDSRIFLAKTREFAHPSMIYKWEPDANHHTCNYCLEEFETTARIKVTSTTRRVCCGKVMCRRQMERDQEKDHDKARRKRQPQTNEQAREKRAATPKEALQEQDRANRAKMDRERFNVTRRRWRANLKAQGKTDRKLQKHTCQFCQQEFENTAEHKLGKRSPVIYCSAPTCFTKGTEEYKEMRRARAREKDRARRAMAT